MIRLPLRYRATLWGSWYLHLSVIRFSLVSFCNATARPSVVPAAARVRVEWWPQPCEFGVKTLRRDCWV